MGSGWRGDPKGEEAAPPRRRYANQLAVTFSLSEIELRFSQQGGPLGGSTLQALVVSSPVHLVTFGQAIQATIAHYERRFGRLPDSADPDTADQPDTDETGPDTPSPNGPRQ